MLTSLARHGKISVPFNVLKQKKINGQDRLPACEADVFLRPATGFVNFKPSALCQSHLQQEKKKKKIDYHTRLVKVNALPPNANSRVRARVANRGRLIRLHARPVPGQSGILFAVRFRIIGQSMRPPPPPTFTPAPRKAESRRANATSTLLTECYIPTSEECRNTSKSAGTTVNGEFADFK